MGWGVGVGGLEINDQLTIPVTDFQLVTRI